MAFFKSRTQTNASADAVKDDAQSMDSLRKQARHRLIGATVLVVIAVVGFPIVFDTKPRDMASDIRIDMPERDAVRPTQPPQAPVPDKAALSQPPISETVSGTEQLVEPDSKKAPKLAAAADDNHAVEGKLVDKSVKSETPKTTTPTPVETASITKPVSKEKAADRFIVQFGAYSDENKIKDVRAKIEKAGVKTYTNVAQTSEGKRTRVRAGPFTTLEEAQKAVNKTKSLQLNAVILTL